MQSASVLHCYIQRLEKIRERRLSKATAADDKCNEIVQKISRVRLDNDG